MEIRSTKGFADSFTEGAHSANEFLANMLERAKMRQQQDQFMQHLAQQAHQFDQNFGEGQRQYNQNFGEGQRQYNQNFGQKGEQFNRTAEQEDRKIINTEHHLSNEEKAQLIQYANMRRQAAAADRANSIAEQRARLEFERFRHQYDPQTMARDIQGFSSAMGFPMGGQPPMQPGMGAPQGMPQQGAPMGQPGMPPQQPGMPQTQGPGGRQFVPGPIAAAMNAKMGFNANALTPAEQQQMDLDAKKNELAAVETARQNKAVDSNVPLYNQELRNIGTMYQHLNEGSPTGFVVGALNYFGHGPASTAAFDQAATKEQNIQTREISARGGQAANKLAAKQKPSTWASKTSNKAKLDVLAGDLYAKMVDDKKLFEQNNPGQKYPIDINKQLDAAGFPTHIGGSLYKLNNGKYMRVARGKDQAFLQAHVKEKPIKVE